MSTRILLLFPLLLAACSDYALKGKDDVSGPGSPEIEVNPLEFDLTVCGTAAATLTIRNLGNGALTVEEMAVDGEGWSLAEAFSPFELHVDESREVALWAAPGSATLTVHSDDPETPSVTVPLSAVADAAPQVTLQAPGEGAILPVGSDVQLSAQVTDDVDPLQSLGLSWSSDVDGLIATDAATADGAVSARWPWTGRSAGSHVLTLQAEDSCGNRSSQSVTLCQQAGYTAAELALASWHFEGSATWDSTNDWLQLTEPLANQVGTAFATDQEVTGDAVEIRFSFYTSGGTGADGLSLTVLDTSRMTTFLGGTGCGMGYGGDAACTAGPALPGWSLEVDTYYNPGQDPTEDDHLMFTFDGDVDDPAAWVAVNDLEDSAWHTLEVVVAAPHLTVTLDGAVKMDQDLAGLTPFPAYVGFTAGTGDQTNYHLIDALEVTEYACATEG